MSLSMASSSSISSSISSSSSESRVPSFPAEREKFDEWKLKIESYLSARNLLSVVLYPCDAVVHKAKLNDDLYKKWLEECEEKCVAADAAKESATTKVEKANVHKDVNVKFQLQYEKSRRAADILLNSFSTKQINLVNNIFPSNAHEIWRVINQSYGAMQNTSTAQSLLKTLIDNKKKTEERISEFISRTDTIIAKLRQHDNNISDKMRVQFIILGLSNDSKYSLATQVLMSMNTNNDLSSEKLEAHLLAEEQRIESANDKKIERALSATTDGETHTLHFHPGRAVMHRGRGRGRGHGRGRGSQRGHMHGHGHGHGRDHGASGITRHNGGRRGQAQNRGEYNNNHNNSHNNSRNNNHNNNINNNNHNTNNNKRTYTREEKMKWLEGVKCRTCGGMGHTQRYCGSKQNGDEANVVDNDEEDNSSNYVERSDELNDEEEGYSTITHTTTASDKSVRWVLDSGATAHHTGNRQLLQNVHKLTTPKTTKTGNGISKYDEVGEVTFKVGNQQMTLTNVIYVPGFSVNLMSVPRLTDNGCTANYSYTSAEVMKGGKILLRASRINHLYIVNNEQVFQAVSNNKETHTHAQSHTTKAVDDTLTSAQVRELQIFHARYGHISYTKLADIIRHECVSGMTHTLANMRHMKTQLILMQQCECVGCVKGKMSRLPMRGVVDHHTHAPLDLWTVDIMGPFRSDSLGGGRYVLVVVDVHTRYIYTKIIKQKSNAPQHIISLITQAQTQKEKKLKRLHSDGAKELMSEELLSYLRSNGTIKSETTAYTPQHNGIVERANRTIMEMVRAMMYHACAYLPFWGEAVHAATHILRRSLARGHPSKSPMELYTGIKPNISNLHVFGCDAYYMVQEERRQGKLDEKARKGIFVGYDDHNSTYYRVYDVDKCIVTTSRDVKFHEETFNEMRVLVTSTENEVTTSAANARVSEDDSLPDAMMMKLIELFPALTNATAIDHEEARTSSSAPTRESVRENARTSSSAASVSERARTSSSAARTSSSANTQESVSVTASREKTAAGVRPSQSTQSRGVEVRSNAGGTGESSKSAMSGTDRVSVSAATSDTDRVSASAAREGMSEESVPQRRSTREKRNRFSLHQDDFAGTTYTTINTPQTTTTTQSTVKRAKIETATEQIPTTYTQAVTSRECKQWKNAIDDEVSAHINNNTWTVVKRRSDMNIVTTKWVFTKKMNESGEVVRYKARWVARGFTQEYGVDYQETFAPVLKAKSFRLIMALSATRNREVRQYDIKTAFLNARVHEDIYVTAPETVKIKHDEVLKLNKALYGLKQASMEWNVEMNDYLVSHGYMRCIKDTCIYIKVSKSNNIIIVGLFVDDILASYNKRDMSEWTVFVRQLTSKYPLTDVGIAKHFLNIRITYDNNNITYIDQQTYTNKVIATHNMNECTTSNLPGDQNIQLNDSKEEADAHEYRAIVGALIYASTWTRPDITHAVNMTSRYMQQPTQTHMRASKKIIRYMRATSEYGIRYNNNNSDSKVTVSAYCDSDWAGDKSDRRSTTGYCVYVNDNLISWNTKKQQTVALSSAEAELMAITEAVKEVIWIREMMTEMKYEIHTPMKIYSDNQSAIHMTHNDVDQERTKHIATRHFFVREKIVSGEMDVEWVQSAKQTADIFTKALSVVPFMAHRVRLVTPVPTATTHNTQQQHTTSTSTSGTMREINI